MRFWARVRKAREEKLQVCLSIMALVDTHQAECGAVRLRVVVELW